MTGGSQYMSRGIVDLESVGSTNKLWFGPKTDKMVRKWEASCSRMYLSNILSINFTWKYIEISFLIKVIVGFPHENFILLNLWQLVLDMFVSVTIIFH